MATFNEDIYEFINDELVISDLIEIRKGVRFGDSLRDFSDEQNERKNSILKSRLQFKWGEIEKVIGKQMVRDLKVLTYFLITAPALFGIKSNNKVNSLQTRIIKICNILEEILMKKQLKLGVKESVDTLSLGDLKLNQFQDMKIPPTRVKDVKFILKHLANSYIQKHLIKPVQWNMSYVKNLNFVVLPKEAYKEIASTPLEEKFYLEIVKLVTVDIFNFKSAMKMPIATTITPEIKKKVMEAQVQFDVEKAFIRYVDILEGDRLYSLKIGKKGHNSASLRRKFPHRYGINVEQLNAFIKDVQVAAIMAILLFTGVRYSEVILLKTGSLQKRNDVYIMKGTVTKHKSKSLPSDIDEWVAIPIVRDAIDILECLQTLTKNSYLVAPLRGVYLDQKNLPLSLGGLTELLNKYVMKSSENNNALKKFMMDLEANKLTIHRFRHSLAQQLVRGRLGLPYISYHFKHINSAVVAYNRVSNVTLGNEAREKLLQLVEKKNTKIEPPKIVMTEEDKIQQLESQLALSKEEGARWFVKYEEIKRELQLVKEALDRQMKANTQLTEQNRQLMKHNNLS